MSFQENIAILGFPEICRRVATLPKLSQIGGKTPCTQNNIRLLEAPISVKYYENAKTWFSILKNLASFCRHETSWTICGLAQSNNKNN